ncbi:MAG: redoxin domain-containing protein, partial [Prevotellaceae bacterium]|nr:redoxin domain-containing protein [Prevotellaceae bacterium]
MTVGDRIPDILGKDQNGNEIKSSDYRGRKIVLYSYPKA